MWHFIFSGNTKTLVWVISFYLGKMVKLSCLNVGSEQQKWPFSEYLLVLCSSQSVPLIFFSVLLCFLDKFWPVVCLFTLLLSHTDSPPTPFFLTSFWGFSSLLNIHAQFHLFPLTPVCTQQKELHSNQLVAVLSYIFLIEMHTLCYFGFSDSFQRITKCITGTVIV